MPSRERGYRRRAAPKPRRRPATIRQRLLRLLLVLVALLLPLLWGGWWLAHRPSFIISMVRPALQKGLGGPVAIGDAELQGLSRLVLTDVVVRSPTHDGQAGEIVRLGTAEIGLDAASLLAGRVKLNEVDIHDLHLRISEDNSNIGTFNFMALEPDWDSDEAFDPDRLPSYIRIHSASLEFGVHEEAFYTPLGRRWMQGRMAPDQDEEGWLSFQLTEHETLESARDDGLILAGRWNLLTNAYHTSIMGLTLDDPTQRMCPTLVRVFWERMDLAGSVSNARLGWSPEDELSVSFDLEDVELTLPIETDSIWARYTPGSVEVGGLMPRLHVTSGSITLDRSSLKLEDLQGELRGAESGAEVFGVPYEITMEIPELPALDWDERDAWLQSLRQHTPFRMEIGVQDFKLPPSHDGTVPAVDLPALVAQFLRRFRLDDWQLTASVVIERQADGSLIRSGSSYIREATGAADVFPYALRDVEAYVQFDGEHVVINYLRGVGSNDAPISIDGRIAGLGKDGDVELHVNARGVPLDDQLRSALNPSQVGVYDTLLDSSALEGLAASGLIVDGDRIEAARSQRDRLQSELDAIDAGDPHAAGLQARIRRLDRLIDAGPFVLGGAIDLDLQVSRDAAVDPRLLTTGYVQVRSIGLLFERFPYPLIVEGGSLVWETDGIEFQPPGRNLPGLPFTTPAGGRGYISGRIDTTPLDGMPGIRPDLTITVEDDAVNPALFAAIPLSSVERDEDGTDGWPGVRRSGSARVLESLGLAGDLDYEGQIQVADDGRPRYSFRVTMDDGTASPSAAFAEAINAPHLRLPRDWLIEGVSGELLVSSDGVQINDLGGCMGRSQVVVNGDVRLAGDSSDTIIDIRLDDLNVGSYVLDMVPPGAEAAAREVWDRYKPQGHFDAELVYRTIDASPQPLTLWVMPEELTVHLEDTPVALHRKGGRVEIGSGRIEFQQLALDVSEVERENGQFLLSGHCLTTASDDGGLPPIELDVQYRGHLDSPRVQALLPKVARQSIEAIRLKDPRPTTVAGHVSIGRDAETGSAARRFEGTVRLDEAALDLGIRMETVTGPFDIIVGVIEDGPTTMRIDGHEVAFTVFDQHVRQTDASFRLDEARDAVVFDHLRGNLHGGAVSADGVIGVGENDAWSLNVDLAAVPLDPLLKRADDNDAEASAETPATARASGTCYAGLSLGGHRGSGQRHGRGLVRLVDNVMQVPVMLQITQLLQLSAVSGVLDYGQADFYIVDNLLTFESILFEASAGAGFTDTAPLQLMGTGTLDLESFHVETRFRSRSGWVLLRDVIGGIGDQLYAIRVTGPLSKPDASIVILPGVAPPPRATQEAGEH